MICLDSVQEEHAEWAEKNFPDTTIPYVLLGIGEELGELYHSELKMYQNIRGTSIEHTENAKDAVGDMIIYLLHYCTLRGISLEEVIYNTWEHVKKRDWKENPVDGGTVQTVRGKGLLSRVKSFFRERT